MTCCAGLFVVTSLPLWSAESVPAGEKKASAVKEIQQDSVLVSVNGQPITLLDVLMETSSAEVRLANMYSGERLYSETEKLRKQVVEDIIIRKLVYEEYKRRPFPIERQYIDRLMDRLAETMGAGTRLGLEKKARQMGISLDVLRDKVKEKIAVDVLIMDACDRPVFVTPKEVYEFYKKNPENWTDPKKYALELLLVSKNSSRSKENASEVCKKIKQQLSSLKEKDDFRSLIRNYSDAPDAERGGSTGYVEENKLRPEFAPVLKKGKEGDILGPVETLEGYYFIRIVSILAEKKIPFEEVSEKIRMFLEETRRAKVRKEYGERLKAGSVIKYYF